MSGHMLARARRPAQVQRTLTGPKSLSQTAEGQQVRLSNQC